MIKKKLYLLLLMAITTVSLLAQKENEEPAPAKNMIKLNLPALALKNITIQYERAVARKVTLAGTFRFMPKGSIPLKSTFVKLQTTRIQNAS